ncbi:hypothetical protein [Sulfuracidifex tepidarius]|uniref:DUF8155 domain-containing protein n=1 Tax=Sulfuracidifex tepidarius TaxID=1294262 RepID=A0A510E192_9CREN|nr:hypothetical protein [Sulfuracidifex tepidarius]BBG23506.1 hypothetical protein IC006_0790 [Sulfuracidifex tepidarius]BBG26259.1 hypothetical protein IC007_0764 [Sulfuracidifex tepidarius]
MILKLKKCTPLSLFSSGFSSHVHGRAVDVSSVDMEVFRAPFSGIFLGSEKVKIGRPNRHAQHDYDVISFIEVEGRKIKMLHVDPFLSPGQGFKEGDEIGSFISSPYTGGDFPHAHLEGVSLRISEVKTKVTSKLGRVMNVRNDSFDVKVIDFASAGKLHGMGIESGGMLNASYPFSCYGGVIGTSMLKGTSVTMYGTEIGKVASKRGSNVSLFEWKEGAIRRWDYDITFKVLRNEPMCGPPFMESVLSYDGYPLVRFFFRSPFKEGDEVDLSTFIGGALARLSLG